MLRTFREDLRLTPEDLSLSPPEDLLSMTMWTFGAWPWGAWKQALHACPTVLAAASAIGGEAAVVADVLP